MRTGRARLGALVLAAYAVVAVATVRLSDHHVRPLYEGIGPAPPYQWVDPPEEFAAGNTKPHAITREVPLGPAGSGLTSLSSGDAQVVVNIPEGAVPPKDGETAVTMTFEPLAPAALPAPPPGLVADGNVYRITMIYKPSGQPVDAVVKPGNIVMALPHPGVTLLRSSDGRRWERIETVTAGGPTTLGARFDRAGWYLGGASPTTEEKKSNTGAVLAAVGVVVVLALGLGLGPVLVRRMRRPKSRGERRRKDRGRR